MNQQEAHTECLFLLDDGHPYPKIIHITFPKDYYLVFRNKLEMIRWKNFNQDWDVRYEEEKFPA